MSSFNQPMVTLYCIQCQMQSVVVALSQLKGDYCWYSAGNFFLIISPNWMLSNSLIFFSHGEDFAQYEWIDFIIYSIYCGNAVLDAFNISIDCDFVRCFIRYVPHVWWFARYISRCPIKSSRKKMMKPNLAAHKIIPEKNKISDFSGFFFSIDYSCVILLIWIS